MNQSYILTYILLDIWMTVGKSMSSNMLTESEAYAFASGVTNIW
jgi:hypothetical protein